MFLLVTRAVAGPSLHTDREIVDISAPGTGQPGSVEVLPAGGARDWVAADQPGSRELGPLNTTAPSPVQTTIRTRPFIEGLLAEREGDYQRAVYFYSRSLELAPDEPIAHYNFGLSLQALGRHAEAKAEFRKVLQLAPDFTDATTALNSYHPTR